MAVQIDDFHAEIEMNPSKHTGETPRDRPVPHAGATQASSEQLKRAVLAVLDAELDHYMRLRG